MTLVASRSSIVTLAVCAFVARSAGLASAAGPTPDPSPAAVSHQKSVSPAPAPAPAQVLPPSVSPAPSASPAPSVTPAPSVSAPVTAPKPKVTSKAKAPIAKKAPAKKAWPVKHPVAKAPVKVPAPTPKVPPVALPTQPTPVVTPPASTASSSRAWLLILAVIVALGILGLVLWSIRSPLRAMAASLFGLLARSLRRRPATPTVAEDAEALSKVAEKESIPAAPYARSYVNWLGQD